MDAPVIVCCRTGTFVWFGHGCSSNRMPSNINDIVVVRLWRLWGSSCRSFDVLACGRVSLTMGTQCARTTDCL